ncbi:MAG: M48 family metallopeptidase [Treponema sp.]|nr:M48 family metallopeptidase [Treponema sp.]
MDCVKTYKPIEVLDSVVVHELCHRRQMNHSKAFYAEVYKLCPNYDRLDK